MKRLWVVGWIGLLGGFWLPSSQAAETSVSPSPAFVAGPDESFDGVIAGNFDGQLLTAQGHLVAIDRGQKDGLLPKTRYAVYRLQKHLSHPLSGAHLGRMLKQVGLIEVTPEVQATTAVARIVRSAEPLEPGDLLRLVKVEPSAP
ncbi:MAG: hypothetical protein HYZ73_08690 [Elusimicrobia bacterium]|nr:hypothetical protein [Elusimicrobiota bacterium]